MPIFEYKAVDDDQKQKKGIIDADSAREARLKLRTQSLYVTDIKETKKGGRQRKIQIKGVTGVSAPNKFRTGQVAQVTRQMASLLGAGIPLAETLRMVIEQSPDKHIEAVMRDIRERVTQGTPFADAVGLHPAYFTELYSNMIRAGEASGALDSVMVRLSDFLQQQTRLKNKVGAAMMYPMIMMVIGVIVVSVLLAFVVPKVTGMLTARGQELPLITSILVQASDFIRTQWLWILVGILALTFLFQWFVNSEKGSLIWDKFKLRVPVFGDLLRKQAVARFAHTFATLLRSGVPAMQAIEVTKSVVDNKVLINALDSVHSHVLEGTDISTPMKMSGAFPPMVSYMVGVGEQASNLEEMLERVAATYDEEVELATAKFTSVLEPLVIVLLAGVVACIVIAIILPIMKVQQIK